MNRLHLLRSEPDATTDALRSELPLENGDRLIELYGDDVVWEEVVDAIFNHDSVVCWW